MKAEKVLHAKQKKDFKERENKVSIKGFVMISLCAVFAIVLAVGSNIFDNGEKGQVYAAADSEKTSVPPVSEAQDTYLPSGIAGVISGVQESPEIGTKINRIGTSCEEVLVGQRVMTVESPVPDLNMSESMAMAVEDFDSKAMAMAENPKIMSDKDYDTLLHIVEAEAGGEDLKGRILVGNVIMNRVKNEEFPDTVTEVVWEYKNGVPQFSPTYDGRINEVVPSETTKEAVRQVMEGVDYSQGALFFLQKSESEAHSVSWFEKDLKRLFKHGVHEFYTYPEEGEATEAEEKAKEDQAEQEANLVQMNPDSV